MREKSILAHVFASLGAVGRTGLMFADGTGPTFADGTGATSGQYTWPMPLEKV